MKTRIIPLLVGLSSFIFAAAPAHANPAPTESHAATNAADYIVRIAWTRDKNTAQFLQVMTTEGSFQLSTEVPTPATEQSGQTQVPNTSINFHGTLKLVNLDHARLNVFLGFSVPVVEKHNGTSTYQVHQEGLSSTVMVTFGKPMVIQKDASGEVSISVRREVP